MRARRGAAALLLTLAALFAPPAARAETYWLDGREVEVSLRPERAAFVLGEPVRLLLNFENRSGDDLEILLSGEQRGERWPDDFEVSVTGPDGRALPRPAAEEGGRRNNYDTLRVPAVRMQHMGTVGVAALFTLDGWAKIEKPGRYTVTCRRGARAGPLGRRYRLFPGTTKPAVELKVSAEFEVAEGGAARVGKLIEELSATMLECTPAASVEAATRLAALEDARVVRHMTAAIGKCRNASIRYTALNSVAKYHTDEALEALRLAAADADEDFRTVAAQALTQNEHPKARELLLSLRDDPYYGVRLMVLNALEAWDTERARRLIWEMTSDEHPAVRDEALRFLQERSAHPPRRSP
jgi:hypothetical protein